MPESTLRWRNFNEKKPYLMCTVFSLVLVGFAVGFIFEQLAESKKTELEKIQPELTKAQGLAHKMEEASSRMKTAQAEADQVASWMEERYYWGDLLSETRAALIRAETDVEKKLSTEKPNVQAGIWIEQMTALAGGAGSPGTPGQPQQNGGSGPSGSETPGSTQTSNSILLVCKAVSLTSVDASANSETAYAVENELKACKYFDPKTTALAGNISADNPDGTFTFGVNVTLQTPPQF